MLTLNSQKQWRVTFTVLVGLAIGAGLATSVFAEDNPAAASKQAVDFERHIAPLFGRLGCSSAACHGAFGGGKGGLQLSLFGYSAKMDYRAVEDRIDRSAPESSLLLLKPSGLENHEGGVRFKPDSDSYQNIKRWIKAGATWKAGSGRVKTLTVNPPRVILDQNHTDQPLTVTAEFNDGSREVVTHLCQFTSRDEGIASVGPGGTVVRSRHGDTSVIVAYGNAFASVTVLAPLRHDVGRKQKRVNSDPSPIDIRINEKLTLLKIVPSGQSTDEEFLRRVMLDTIGAIPAPDQVTRFCADTAANKREKMIDQLLAHPMHAALWATRMCDITKCDVGAMGEDQLLGARRAQMWHDWFRRRFDNNMPYDEIVRNVVTATSRQGLDVGQWMKQEEQLIHRSRESFDNHYADRDSLDLYWRRTGADSEAILKANAELTAVAFTGVRLNCAQCHKHPFDRWSQDDYAAFANIFARTIYGSSTETNSAVLAELARRRETKNAGQSVKPLPRIREVFDSIELARGLSGSEPGANVSPRAFDSREFDPHADLRQQFFQWLVAPENPYFARSFVNRVWAAYFGIGLVDPVDDFSVTNPPSHPRLLDELAQRFRESKFDIRELEKQILMSSAYQRTATPNESNLDDRRNFSRQHVRPLLAEVALDALNKALGTTEDFGNAARDGALAIEVGSNELEGDAGRVLQVFGRGKREATCDCDRRIDNDLRQFIFLINDQSVMDKIRNGSIRELLSLGDRELVKRLYLRVLGRKASRSEVEVGVGHLSQAEQRE
ncbi:MAG: DUF1549 and DUF1553 domain-containing protein, partial [Pirellulales bacterium]|nr:DUF1549 and DUF1553 domain-containing protein [Pirellulales bacterium]